MIYQDVSVMGVTQEVIKKKEDDQKHKSHKSAHFKALSFCQHL